MRDWQSRLRMLAVDLQAPQDCLAIVRSSNPCVDVGPRRAESEYGGPSLVRSTSSEEERLNMVRLCSSFAIALIAAAAASVSRDYELTGAAANGIFSFFVFVGAVLLLPARAAAAPPAGV